jgi:carbamoyl-phosphate synthase large subunit
MVEHPAMTPYSGRVFRVLVFPGGTEIGLEINSALRQCKDVELFSAGLATSNHAPFVYAQHFDIPSIHEQGWVDAVNELIFQLGINYIFPAYDDVLVALAENRDRIKASVATSPLETCLVTRSKRQTYRRFRDVLPVPHVYESASSVDRFPVFVKPDKGQGSQNTHLVHHRDQLAVVLRLDPSALVLEHLPGEEYTIDCFSDRDRGLLFCAGRERTRIRNGICMSSHGIADKEFRDFAKRISGVLAFHGAWFFQLKRDSQGKLKLLEIAPRIAGAMATHRILGVNFPLLSLYEQERLPIRIMTNPIEVVLDRALTNRYRHNLRYSTVYVDLDDTLILRGRVNVRLVAFLHQCINDRIKVVLLTRHAAEVEETLRRHRLFDIFDEIVRVAPRPDCKSTHIKERDAILIDDSFSERYAVATTLGLPTFDCSMLEMLMDDRA